MCIRDSSSTTAKENANARAYCTAKRAYTKSLLISREFQQPQQDIPTIAKAWGEKIQTLDPKQRIFAEKAINDILFEASIGTLHRNSVRINEFRCV